MSTVREAAERILRDVGVPPVGAALEVTVVIIENAFRSAVQEMLQLFERMNDPNNHHRACNMYVVGRGEQCDCNLAELMP